MTLSFDNLDQDIADLIAAKFTPELIQERRMKYLDDLKAKVEATPPCSRARVIRQHELCEAMARQIMREVPA